jgi:hypothetical protein
MVLSLAWVMPAIAGGPGRCTTSEEPTLGRRQTLCADGTRAVSTDNRTLARWDTTSTTSPRPACTGRLNPKTRLVERRWR